MDEDEYIRNFIERDYPACVGLAYIGYWRRYECWNDMKDRPFPLYARFLPKKWIRWDRNGSYVRGLKWLRKYF